MPYRVPTALDLSDAERAELGGWARRHKTTQALALRARIVLRAAVGLSNTAIAAELGIAKHRCGAAWPLSSLPCPIYGVPSAE